MKIITDGEVIFEVAKRMWLSELDIVVDFGKEEGQDGVQIALNKKRGRPAK
mgnify:CR=1 FL=1